MTEEQLKEIEQRNLGIRKPISVGDTVTIESFTGADYVPHASGKVTTLRGDELWLDDKPTRYFLVDAHRNEPTPKDDISTLLAEVRHLQAFKQRFVEAYNNEDNTALDTLYREMKGSE